MSMWLFSYFVIKCFTIQELYFEYSVIYLTHNVQTWTYSYLKEIIKNKMKKKLFIEFLFFKFFSDYSV